MHSAQLIFDWILSLEMASQRRWNLFLQKTCLCGEIWGGRNQFGCDVAVDIERLAAVPKMQVQNPRALENKCIPQWFPGNHSQKNLIENFVDPVVSAFADSLQSMVTGSEPSKFCSAPGIQNLPRAEFQEHPVSSIGL